MTKKLYDPLADCGTVDNCPILYTLGLIGQKWKVPVLWHIAQRGPLRYGQLKRIMHGVSGTMLSKSLKELCAYGILERRVCEGAVDEVYYQFTPRGAELAPILDQLFDWGSAQMLASGLQPLRRDNTLAIESEAEPAPAPQPVGTGPVPASQPFSTVC